MNLITIDKLTPMQIASICDHTYLNRSEAFREKANGKGPVYLRKKEFNEFLEEVVKSELVPYGVCVRPEDLEHTHNFIKKHNKENIKLVSVIGFPDGSLYSTMFKYSELRQAISYFADEIDMVLNYDKLINGEIDYVKYDISKISKKAHKKNVLVKLILETSELNEDEIKKSCEIAERCGIDFVKTSTGFSAYGAHPRDLRIMKANFNRGIKISGGVNVNNVKDLLFAASGRNDRYINLDPMLVRIGESSLLKSL